MQIVIPEGGQKAYETNHFAPAVIDGDRVFLSGAIGMDENGKVPSDPETQFVLLFERVKTVLEAAGASLDRIVEMTTYHVDFHEHLMTFVEVKDRYLKDPYPAWTGVGVTTLARRKWLVEIRIIASLKA